MHILILLFLIFCSPVFSESCMDSKSSIIDPQNGEFFNLYWGNITESFVPLYKFSENIIPVLKKNDDDLAIIVKHLYDQSLVGGVASTPNRELASMPIADKELTVDEVKELLKKMIKF